MQDRSLSSVAMTLMLMVVASAAFLQVVRLHENGTPLRDIALILLLVLPLMALLLGIVWLCDRISHTRTGRALRAGVTGLFVLSTMAILGMTAYIWFSAAGNAQYGLPEANTLALQVCAIISVLSAPVGWRALVDYTGRRQTATMPFFQASPVRLSITFMLVTALILALGTSQFLSTGSTSLGTGSFSVIGLTLLVCMSLTIPLILLARLLQISGAWLRQRWARP